jgi:hypothetical protein
VVRIDGSTLIHLLQGSGAGGARPSPHTSAGGARGGSDDDDLPYHVSNGKWQLGGNGFVGDVVCCGVDPLVLAAPNPPLFPSAPNPHPTPAPYPLGRRYACVRGLRLPWTQCARAESRRLVLARDIRCARISVLRHVEGGDLCI